MKRMMMLICLSLLTGLLLNGCGGGGAIFNDPTCANSPHGWVPYGAKAYSPDGTSYATEIKPYDHGNIGIFNKSNDQLLLQFDAVPAGNSNDLKGIAWSRDSRYLAIMYHGGMSESGINLYDAQDGQKVRFIGPGSDERGFYHYLVFDRTGTLIYVSFDGKTIARTFSSGLGEIADKTPPSIRASVNQTLVPASGGVVQIKAVAEDKESGVSRVWTEIICQQTGLKENYDLKRGMGFYYLDYNVPPNPSSDGLPYIAEIFAQDNAGNLREDVFVSFAQSGT